MMDDKTTRCRFVTALPNHEEVLVTSMRMNKIYIINLNTDTTQTLGPFRKPDEADPLAGLILTFNQLKPPSTLEIFKNYFPGRFDITEPSGIVVDPVTGMIFVSSCKKKSIEVLAPNFTFLGTLIQSEKLGPLGLVIKDRHLFIANCEEKSIMRIQLPKD